MTDLLPTGRALLDPNRILEEAGIRENMKVADFGVGAVGHFLFPAAKMVGPKGTVVGIDILKPVLQAIQSRAKSVGLENIEYVWGDIERLGGTKLPDHSMDLVILVNVLHLTKKGKTLEEAKRILGTEGTLLIVDWNPAGAPFGPAPDHRISKEDAVKIATGAGFALKKEFSAGTYHYGLVFTKPRT